MEASEAAAGGVRQATDSDRTIVVNTILLAFASDPMVRWCWREAGAYLAHMPTFVVAFGGKAFAHGSAHCMDDGTAAALWLPPEEAPDTEAMVGLMEETLPPEVRSDAYRVMEQMQQFHPSHPHWYLPMIGVDPAFQGRGHGSKLLAYALEQCDRDGLPAYLESSNPRNVPLYVRHGFRVLGEIQCGTSPRLVPMLRTPRSPED